MLTTLAFLIAVVLPVSHTLTGSQNINSDADPNYTTPGCNLTCKQKIIELHEKLMLSNEEYSLESEEDYNNSTHQKKNNTSEPIKNPQGKNTSSATNVIPSKNGTWIPGTTKPDKTKNKPTENNSAEQDKIPAEKNKETDETLPSGTKPTKLKTSTTTTITETITTITTTRNTTKTPKNHDQKHKDQNRTTSEAPEGHAEITNPSNLAWVLYFKYGPEKHALKSLFVLYASHFKLIVILAADGRGPIRPNPVFGAEIILAPFCDSDNMVTKLGVSIDCSITALNSLKANPKYKEIDFVLFTDDATYINITRLKELAKKQRPIVAASTHPVGPLLFPGTSKVSKLYWEGWTFSYRWLDCQPEMEKVPEKYRERYEARYGTYAMKGPVNFLFLPTESIPEFLELARIMKKCFSEIAIPNVFGMLGKKPIFYEPEDNVIISDRGYINDPGALQKQLAMQKSPMLSISPCALNAIPNREKLMEVLKQYKLI